MQLHVYREEWWAASWFIATINADNQPVCYAAAETVALFSSVQGEFDLTNTQDGFLATAFLVGLLLASPVFSESCKHYRWDPGTLCAMLRLMWCKMFIE